MTDFRDHPDYSDGFFDARDGKVLAAGTSPEYCAGWNAFHGSRKIFQDAGFKVLDGGMFQKRSVIYPEKGIT